MSVKARCDRERNPESITPPDIRVVCANRAPTYSDLERTFQWLQTQRMLLHEVTSAFESSRIPYAVIGGFAVQAWVSTIDPDATRNTADIDLLVNRADLFRITELLGAIGLTSVADSMLPIFVSADNLSPRSGVHLHFANEKFHPDDVVSAPSAQSVSQNNLGFRVVSLLDLITMELQSFRLHQQVDLIDLFEIGLIDATWKSRLPIELQDRFDSVFLQFEHEEVSRRRMYRKEPTA